MVRGLSNDSEICLSYIRQCKKSKYISGIHRISEVKIEKGFIFYVSAVKYDPLVRLGPISDDSIYLFYDFFILALHIIVYHTL